MKTQQKTKHIGMWATVVFADTSPFDRPALYYISFGKEVVDHNGDVLGDSYGVEDINIFYYFDDEEVKQVLTAFENGDESFSVGDEWKILLGNSWLETITPSK